MRSTAAINCGCAKCGLERRGDGTSVSKKLIPVSRTSAFRSKRGAIWKKYLDSFGKPAPASVGVISGTTLSNESLRPQSISIVDLRA